MIQVISVLISDYSCLIIVVELGSIGNDELKIIGNWSCVNGSDMFRKYI